MQSTPALVLLLPVLSKVYDQRIDENSTLYDLISAYRKGQSTIIVLQVIRADILKAMKRGEVTMMVQKLLTLFVLENLSQR